MTQEDAERVVHDLKVAGVAHAIRLGKRPDPGMTMGANVSLVQIDGAGATSTKKQPFEYVITAEMIAEADQMINSQRAQFKEPKNLQGIVPTGLELALKHMRRQMRTL